MITTQQHNKKKKDHTTSEAQLKTMNELCKLVDIVTDSMQKNLLNDKFDVKTEISQHKSKIVLKGTFG